MKPLYVLTGIYLKLLDLMDDPEIDQGDLDAYFEEINDDIEIKADNYARIIKNMENQLEGIKAEKKRLTDRQGIIEKNIDHLKDNLQQAMVIMGKTKFKTDLFSFSIQKNGGTLPVIVDVKTDELPDDLVIVSEKPDLKAIAKYIEETGDITFAHFGERGESLRIK